MLLACITHLSSQPSWLLLLTSLGFLSLLKLLLSLLRWIFATVLRPPKNLKTYGSWAVVTGATDGIGKAFAHQLAQKGLNLILVGRNQGKLKRVSSEIQENYPNTHIKSVVFDFSSSNMLEGVKRIKEAIKEVDVGVLVNNVGVTYPNAMYLHEVSEEVWLNVMRVNLEGATWVTKAVLPGMILRRRGAIVNVGSGASIVVPSHPLYTIYAASKAYVDQLSRCLHVEYKQCGIDVQCQVPLYVATKMANKVALIDKPSLFIPTPTNYAKAAISHIGYEARCTPYWSHSLQWFLASLLPESALDNWRLSIGLRRREAVQSNMVEC